MKHGSWKRISQYQRENERQNSKKDINKLIAENRGNLIVTQYDSGDCAKKEKVLLALFIIWLFLGAGWPSLAQPSAFPRCGRAPRQPRFGSVRGEATGTVTLHIHKKYDSV